ncbi:hypothetical protein [Chryseobacterium oranimense]|uniref:hypothetical protein n=1 Tax=Chryseobacterium oranimense TaxID=421058 RepID=UPI0031E0E335
MSFWKYLLFANICFFFLISCNSEQFDKEKWLSGDSALYSGHRKKMLNDLMKNILRFEYGNKKGTSKKEVIKLIGKPDQINKETGAEIYFIEEKTGLIDPKGYINLHLIYKSDSTLISWRIENVDYKE